MIVMRQSACLVVNTITSKKLWCPLKLYDSGSGLRLNDGLGVKRSSLSLAGTSVLQLMFFFI